MTHSLLIAVGFALSAVACGGSAATAGPSPPPESADECRVQGSADCGVAVPLTCGGRPELADLARAMGTAEADCWQPGADEARWCCIARSGTP